VEITFKVIPFSQLLLKEKYWGKMKESILSHFFFQKK
jgi:hypothetical protein